MIPLFSPVRQNESLFDAIQASFTRLLGSGEYILGPAVAEFEKELAQTTGYAHTVGCSSGTEALILALKALGLPPDSEVLTPAFSFVASASSILWAGLNPVLADVELETGIVTVAQLEAALTPKTRAVIAVDLYGRQVDIVAIRAFCQAHNLFLIEDGAQSIGVPHRGADFYTLSFYPTKNIGGVGDAGAIATNDLKFSQKLHRLTQHGAVVRDQYDEVGTNGRLDTLQASILRHKLPHVHKWTEKRREIVSFYRKALQPLADKERLILPPEPVRPEDHVWALFTLQIENQRDRLAAQLREKGVGCGVYYSQSLNRQKVLAPFVQGKSFPNADKLSQTVLSLPLFPELTHAEREEVVTRFIECLDQNFI